MSTGLCPRDIPEASQPRSHHPIQSTSTPTGTMFTSSLAWKPLPPRITFLSHRSEKVLTVKPPLPSLCPASGPPQFRRVPRGAVRARAEGRVLGSPLPAPSSAAEKAQAVLPGGCEDWSLLPSLIRVLSVWACAALRGLAARPGVSTPRVPLAASALAACPTPRVPPPPSLDHSPPTTHSRLSSNTTSFPFVPLIV